ncbi:uncharacterized protein LOC123322714 isoform X2 [Coccinella septempunctata]|uniref:uncharacterized protein LOC123322714 isoform X2 n=1 Tax=Coccinella septempunctata TaxID=41139 RepID=UPI001D078379|nr:uncharacterized protein LOC123322714 isoform X2 [Coccinella septempunctata]
MEKELSNENVEQELSQGNVSELGERTISELSGDYTETKNVQEIKSPFTRLLKIPKVLSTEMINKVLTREPIFKNIYTSDSFTDLLPDEKAEKLASILVSGFGLKNVHQLQEALEADKIVKSKKTEAEQFPCVCSEESSEKSEPLPPPMAPPYSIEERVRYLLQLEEYIELEGEMGSIPPPRIEEEVGTEGGFDLEALSPLKKARRYLKDHKVFQFFQFLVSHLLSAVPEDPIDYLLTLLDRVLLYRTGLLSPPLLYEKKHIEQLFHLMDRFGQGYVDIQQYKTAMETFGICSYNKRPFLNNLSMVSKEVFIEEIFSAELAMFNDLIKSRVSCTCDLTAPPPTIIDMDLKTQSSYSIDDSILSTQFNPVASVGKFWEKHGDKQPKAFKGKFWSEFVREAQRRDSIRRESKQNETDGKG